MVIWKKVVFLQFKSVTVYIYIMEENQQYTQEVQSNETAPYAITSLVLGIASLVVSGLGITLALGIIGLVFSNKGLAEIQKHPGKYSGDGMLRAGKVTSILGIVLSSIALALIILLIVGMLFFTATTAGVLDILD